LLPQSLIDGFLKWNKLENGHACFHIMPPHECNFNQENTKEEIRKIRKILRTWLDFGGILEPMIFQLFLDIYLVPFFPRKSFI